MQRAIGREIENPHVYLWRIVIRRAQEEADGMYVYEGANRRVKMYKAQRWLTHEDDFFTVCRYANLDPEQAHDVRNAAIAKYGGRIGSKEWLATKLKKSN